MRIGCKHSEETKRKISIKKILNARKGYKHSEESKKKMSISLKGKKFSEKHILALSASHKGQLAWNRGKSHTEEAIQKMRDAHKGGVCSDETKNKMSEVHKGLYHSYERTLKRIEYNRGGFWYGSVIYHEYPQYCEKFNNEFKERVRAYRSYCCFECGTPQNGKLLSVHHVHYDKKMCCNGSPHDVVPLCTSCHTKTNTNRDYWEDHFTELIYAYDPEGKCFFTKEEMLAYSKGDI
jgi:hypothetical protein